jgi:hypothetical protein
MLPPPYWNYWAWPIENSQQFLINLKGTFMYGRWQLFSPTLLVEMEGSLLIRWVALYSLTSVWRRGERGKYTCALTHLASPGRAGRGVAWRGEARRWAHVHDMCVNSPPKSGPNPRRPTASFCRLFLLQVNV